MEGNLRSMTAIYLFKNNRVLLLFREGGRVVNNVWTGSAGGHFEEFELNDAKACVIREMDEELGLKPDDVDGLLLRYITLRYTNGEIRQNYYFFANLKEHVNEELHSNEGTCKWFSLDEIASLEMPFTAKYVIEHFCKAGYMTDRLYVGVTTNECVEFFDLPKS